MAPGINQINARSRETLVLSILNVFLLRNVGTILQKEIYFPGSKIIILSLIVQLMK